MALPEHARDFISLGEWELVKGNSLMMQYGLTFPQQILQVERGLRRLFSPVLSLKVGLTLPKLVLTDVCTTRPKASSVIEDEPFLHAIFFWGYPSLL